MRKPLSKLLAVIISSFFVFGALGTLTACNNQSDANTFMIWMASSVNSSIYNNYGSNPVAQYLQKKFDINLEFVSPIVGKEQEDFNKLIGSGEYPDIMDLSYYNDVLADLYDDGYGAAMDITSYIADYMPNYTKFLTDNPELTKYAKVDGKYISLNNYNEAIPNQWGGFMYRRDWLVKYDGNEDKPDADGNYKDGVKFPDGYLDADGYDNPLTIRDWEYMFTIFKKCPDYKYAITLPNKGYHETGEIVSAFGIGGLWNLYEETTDGVYDVVKFGGTSDAFRKYAETMNKWYTNGWLDRNFTSNSGDLFYALDAESFTSGNVGMWYGVAGQVGDALKDSTISALKDIDVWAARHPKETATSSDPKVFYLDGQETARRWIVTKTAKDKNLDKLFKALDWLYSEEGAITIFYGLSTEQWNEFDIDKSLIDKYGLQDGCYWWVDSNGDKVEKGTEGALLCQNLKTLNATDDLAVAVSGKYFFGLGFDENSGKTYLQNAERKQHAYREWGAYNNYGTVKNSLIGQMTSKEGGNYNTIQERIRESMEQKL